MFLGDFRCAICFLDDVLLGDWSGLLIRLTLLTLNLSPFLNLTLGFLASLVHILEFVINAIII